MSTSRATARRINREAILKCYQDGLSVCEAVELTGCRHETVERVYRSMCIARRCHENGYSFKTAVKLSGCSDIPGLVYYPPTA